MANNSNKGVEIDNDLDGGNIKRQSYVLRASVKRYRFKHAKSGQKNKTFHSDMHGL